MLTFAKAGPVRGKHSMTYWTNRRVGFIAGVFMIVVPAAVGVLWLTTPGGLQTTLLVNGVFAAVLTAVSIGGVTVLVRSRTWVNDR
jgi:hypothetical protein